MIDCTESASYRIEEHFTNAGKTSIFPKKSCDSEKK